MKKTTMYDAGADSSAEFDDKDEYVKWGLGFPTAIYVRKGDAIDQIGMCYTGKNLPRHGSMTGTEKILPLNQGERIIKISGTTQLYWNNVFLFQLKFYTTEGRTLEIDTGAGKQGFPFEITFDDGEALACIYGKTANPRERSYLTDKAFLSAIGVYTQPYKER